MLSKFWDVGESPIHSQVGTWRFDSFSREFDEGAVDTEQPGVGTDSEISTGTSKNIVLPYRIFSEKMPQEEGISLNLKDENGIPLIFKRGENEIYGMEVEKYTKHIQEIMSYITDEKKAKMAGIRSVYGNAVHKKVRKGETFTIWVEQTGGLVIKKAAQF